MELAVYDPTDTTENLEAADQFAREQKVITSRLRYHLEALDAHASRIADPLVAHSLAGELELRAENLRRTAGDL